MPPTIFFATNTGSQSIHADWIRRVCAEVNTPSFNRHFEIISCIKDNPLEILQEIQHYKKELIFLLWRG
ncbi:MAG: hypothetical protein R3E79_57300 [Caldilineaceae bacterium]